MLVKIAFQGCKNCSIISCDDEKLLLQIKNLLVGFNIENIDSLIECVNNEVIVIRKIESRIYSILYDGEEATYTEPQAIGFTVRSVLDLLGKDTENNLFLHGGCVQYSGKIYCFLGKTKSGKSTFTYYLCQKENCKYITDDLICLNRENNCVPFMKPVFLREDKYINQNDDFVIIEYQDDNRYCIIPQQMADKNQCYNIDIIVILERNPHDALSIEKLSIPTAFMSIWQNMHTSENISAKRAIAMELAKKTNVYKVSYREVIDDLDVIIGMIG